MPWTLHSSNLNFCNPLCELAAQKSTRNFLPLNEFKSRAAVMAQLVERTLPTPEVCCSKPVIAKISIVYFFTCQLN